MKKIEERQKEKEKKKNVVKIKLANVKLWYLRKEGKIIKSLHQLQALYLLEIKTYFV